MKLREAFKWANSSLVGHLAFWELFGALPFFLWFLPIIHSEGDLTIAWAFRMAFVSAAIWATVGALFWYTVSKPRIERWKKTIEH